MDGAPWLIADRMPNHFINPNGLRLSLILLPRVVKFSF
jgi:hypothetical protein